MNSIWEEILKFGNSVENTDTLKPKIYKRLFEDFSNTHCFEQHCIFGDKKCGASLYNDMQASYITRRYICRITYPILKKDHHLSSLIWQRDI